MATRTPHYDKELQKFLDDNPEIGRTSLGPKDIGPLREAFVSEGGDSLIAGRELDLEEWTVVARDGSTIPVSTIRKKKSTRPKAALFHIHSGGMVAGDRFIGMQMVADWVVSHDLVCTTVDYRLSPENQFPVPLHDCYDALTAFAGNLNEETPLVLVGMSAGGGLAAGLAQMALDTAGPNIAGQLLMCPMLDYRNSSVSSNQFQNLGLWDKGSNDTGWNAYLGDKRKSNSPPAYGSPSHRRDLRGLPSTFLDSGALEVFRSEIISYGESLAAADVPVELHIWPGAFHGFDLAHPTAQISQEAIQSRERWLLRLIERSIR